MKLYCKQCGECHVPVEQWQTDKQKHFVAMICYSVIVGLLVAFGLFSLIKWGIVDGIANGIVLMVLCFLVAIALTIWRFLPEYKAFVASSKEEQTPTTTVTCNCGATYEYKLNKFLLFVFPPKVYRDYGVENLKPWVDPEPKRKRKKAKEQ